MNFARIFARISLVFLLKMRPYFARIFTKMSPYEELVTLRWRLHSTSIRRLNRLDCTWEASPPIAFDNILGNYCCQSPGRIGPICRETMHSCGDPRSVSDELINVDGWRKQHLW